MSTSSQKIAVGTRFSRWLDRLRGRPVEWNLERYKRQLAAIELRARELSLGTSDADGLRAFAGALQKRAESGVPLQDLAIDSFALAREATTRAVGLRPFDEQVLAGLALLRGHVIEMPTGEGKTLVAVLPTFLHALAGQGAHVLTFNEYLARRDAEWMGPTYALLGLTVAHVSETMSTGDRRRAYSADVTYATVREVGYDFLRDGLAFSQSARVLKQFHFALVDEADSLLIDEARVPLVIAGADKEQEGSERETVASLVRTLEEGRHFQTDPDRRNVFLTDEGRQRVQDLLACGDLHEPSNRDTATLIQQALHARVLLARNVDYIVRNGRVEIVDEFTGRVVTGRHWPDGLHRAVEGKEGLRGAGLGRVLGSITTQHLVGLYPHFCGMTGTVLPSDHELELFYRLETTVIPPHRPCGRVDRPDLLFAHGEDKRRAVVEEVTRAHRAGRPVLVGTASIVESLDLAQRLQMVDIPCKVLNAANDVEEAAIIAEAGALGAVTVSTNMAGRGVDIRLGGSDERDRDEVVALGGLYVVGTNRFESRRVDDQLRGRAGRQGEPGESRFFVSLEDDLMVRHDINEFVPLGLLDESGDTPIEDPLIHRKLAVTQRNIEWQNLQIRRTVWDYGSFIERQRRVVAERREGVLTGEIKPPRELAPSRYAELAPRVPPDVLDEVERRISLFHIDRGWAEHLANVADIREGIHLARLGGGNPLHEFLKLAVDALERMERSVDEGIRQSYERAEISPTGIDLDREGLRGPSSTWTYLVNDNPFEWALGLSAPGNIGLGIAAGVWGGLFVIQAFGRRFSRRRRDTVDKPSS